MTTQPVKEKYKPFRYELPPEIAHEEKLQKAKQDTATAMKELDEANSASGFAKTAGKKAVEMIAPSETGLGETVGSIINTQWVS